MKPKKNFTKEEITKPILELVIKAVAFDAIKYSQKFPN